MADRRETTRMIRPSRRWASTLPALKAGLPRSTPSLPVLQRIANRLRRHRIPTQMATPTQLPLTRQRPLSTVQPSGRPSRLMKSRRVLRCRLSLPGRITCIRALISQLRHSAVQLERSRLCRCRRQMCQMQRLASASTSEKYR